MLKGIVIVLALAGTSFAQLSDSQIKQRLAELNAKAAATRGDESPATRPTAKPDIPPAELLAQGIAAMRAARWPDAESSLARAYREAKPADVTRALVIDRAIVDYVQGRNVTRAVKDLSSYLMAHPDDEEAVDLLGAAGHKAIMRNPRFAKSTLCNEAASRLASCVLSLESKKPGMRKWGAQWMNAAQFATIQEQQRRCQGELDEATSRIASAKNYLDEARANAARYNVISTGNSRVGGYGGDNGAAEEAHRQDVQDANERIRQAQSQLNQEVARADAIRARFPQPTWPDVFQPVDPSASVAATQPVIAPSQAAPPQAGLFGSH